MSQTPLPQQVIETTVAAVFAKLDDDQRNKFVDDTLSALINSIADPESQKRFRRIMMKLQVRKQLKEKEQQWVNQIVVSFLWSVKEEFRYQMSFLIYLMFRQQPPEDLPQKISAIKQYMYIHAPLLPPTFSKLEAYAHATKSRNYDELVNNLLTGVQANPANPKVKG